MMNIKYGYLLIFVCISLASCSRRTTSAYYKWETIFIKSADNGSEVYKHFAVGSNKSESVSQSEIDVLKEIIFKGVASAPNPRPLVYDVNAEEKYRNYFESFFKEGGDYIKYVELYRNGNLNNSDRIKTGKRHDRKMKGMEITVKKASLRKTLENANIISVN